jgi:hypothetical protein
MKRSDVTTQVILSAVDRHGVHAWEVLIEEVPPKLVLAAMQREVDADRLTYGVALHRPFLTDKGRAFLIDGEGSSQ